MERIIREATKIELHLVNMNREEGFSLRKSCKPLLQNLIGKKKAPLPKKK
jgi:hypothetical protein